MSVVSEAKCQLCNNVRQWLVENHGKVAVAVGGIFVTWKMASALADKMADCQRKKAWKKWENSPKDVVILHILPRGKTVPDLSPFALKLETYLRAAKIPHEIDFESRGKSCGGPLGKTPWITLNGEHMADSQLIINFLNNVGICDAFTSKDPRIRRSYAGENVNGTGVAEIITPLQITLLSTSSQIN